MANAAAEEADALSSALVRECLGFAPASSRLDALVALCASLGRAAAPTVVDSDASGECEGGEELRAAWRALVNGPWEEGAAAGDGGEGGPAPPARVLRDGLVRSLVECCRPSEDDDLLVDDATASEDLSPRIVELALRSLARLVRLRPTSAEETALGVPPDPLFGHDFADGISPDVLRALGDGVASGAASDLVSALLDVDRPRNEACGAAVRDAVLTPATDVGGAGNDRSAAAAAGILSAAIVGGTEPPGAEGMDPEELAMRRETAALGRMQDLRDALANVGRACAAELRKGGGGGPLLDCLRSIHEVAPFAVESQLETLLGEDEAGAIAARLGGDSDGVGRADDEGADGLDASADMSEDGDLAALNDELRRCDGLPPLYDGMAGGPIAAASAGDVEGIMADVAGRMGDDGPDAWDSRLAALVDVERLLAGGVLSSPGGLPAASAFVECLRRTALPDQFLDLRSQITGQACRVLVALAYESRGGGPDGTGGDDDDRLLRGRVSSAASHVVEACVPGVLDLCKSGTRLMAKQGADCLGALCAVSGPSGHPRIVPRLADEVVQKRGQKGRKRGSAMGLTAALRTWDAGSLDRHADAIAAAARSAGSDRDPSVREEGRRMYWAMRSCGGAVGELAEGMYDGRSREMRTLAREREGIDAEWEEGGRLAVLAETGVPGDGEPAKPAPAKRTSRPARVSVFRQKGNGNAGKRGPGSRLREMGAPFKSAKASTPMKTASAGVVTAEPPSAGGGSDAVDGGEAAVAAEKENAAASGTPAKSVGFRIFRQDRAASSPPAASSGGYTSPPAAGTPLVNLLARASPLSPERIARESADPVGEIVSRLSDRSEPGEQRLAVKALALYAKENGRDLSPLPSATSGGDAYSRVMGCLLDQIAAVRDADDDMAGGGAFASPSRKGMSPRHQMQHIFLQGVRSLVQFVPVRLETGEVRRIVDSLMEVRGKLTYQKKLIETS